MNVDIAIFARAPVAGQAKTRLIPKLGAEGAAALNCEPDLWILRQHALKCGPLLRRVDLRWERAGQKSNNVVIEINLCGRARDTSPQHIQSYPVLRSRHLPNDFR